MLSTTQPQKNNKRRCRQNRNRILEALANQNIGQPVFKTITANICYCVNNGE
jgi:hypothetical protein